MKKQNIKSLQVKKEKVTKLQPASMASLKGGGAPKLSIFNCPIIMQESPR